MTTHTNSPGVSWRSAASATLHCLTGCAIGEVLGMVIGTALGLPQLATVALAVALAFVFGYALTMRGVLRAGLGFRQALKVALAADTLSITVMEIIDNAAMLSIPGAMHAGLASWYFWGSLAVALALAFVVTTPVNRWLMSRGKGHAVVHAYHGHGDHGDHGEHGGHDDHDGHSSHDGQPEQAEHAGHASHDEHTAPEHSSEHAEHAEHHGTHH
ncbi:DUF4396 domain-containing protein [Desertivibrio insolitus]|uniref:DUF4396 domain-containing protein n=1 Tax=Herbiconiux sp. SYSU D00978 TaxID=2812562 RepID=UPI001A97C88D|nr:DUF4396 domain-containing protein [Herbiconiux sp. SYSU D00978]